MDNIKKKTVLQNVTTMCKYISIVIPAIVDIFSVVALFASGLQNWINNIIESTACIIIIIVVVNILLIANIFVFVEKTIGIKTNKATKFIDGYTKILKNYTEYLTHFEDTCKTITSIEELYSETSTCLKTFVDDVKEVLSKITGKKYAPV